MSPPLPHILRAWPTGLLTLLAGKSTVVLFLSFGVLGGNLPSCVGEFWLLGHLIPIWSRLQQVWLLLVAPPTRSLALMLAPLAWALRIAWVGPC